MINKQAKQTANIIKKLFFLILLTNITQVYATPLDTLTSKIHEKEHQILKTKEEKESVLTQLNKQKKAIEKVNNKLKLIQLQLDNINKDIQQKDLHYKKLTQTSDLQIKQLNKLAKTIYTIEKTSFTKQLLAEQDQKSIRIKHILQRLYKEQNLLVQQSNQTKLALQKQQQQIHQKYNEQQQKEKEQQRQQKELEQQQAKYKDLLQQVNTQLITKQQQLAQLKQNEKELRQKIKLAEQQEKERAQKELIKRASKGLGKPHKQYPKPVNGEIIHSFGSVKLGEVHWKGIVIKAPQGSPVHAITDGRVILAGHLQGYGLIVIIKHGKNDLTLYGYNQSLKVKQGDVVLAGQTIASVGQVSGKAYSGTYFEITHKGNPINPIKWLK